MEVLYYQTTQLIEETSILFQKLEKDPFNCEHLEKEIQSKIQAINA